MRRSLRNACDSVHAQTLNTISSTQSCSHIQFTQPTEVAYNFKATHTHRKTPMDNVENALWHRFFRSCSILLSIEATLSIILSYYAGFFLSKQFHFTTAPVAGLWCAISGIIVLQVLVHESFSAAWIRILGSFLGAATSYVFSMLMGYTMPALAVCVFITVILTSLFQIKVTFRLASLTAAIVIIVGSLEPAVSPLINAFSRFAESAIGAVIAIIITALFYPLRKKLQLLNH